MQYIEHFSTMTVAEFKAYKRALATLLRLGIQRSDAIEILSQAISTRTTRRIEEQEYRIRSLAK